MAASARHSCLAVRSVFQMFHRCVLVPVQKGRLSVRIEQPCEGCRRLSRVVWRRVRSPKHPEDTMEVEPPAYPAIRQGQVP